MARKKGKLSTEDENYILSNVGKASLEDIAEHLNRNLEPIKKFVTKRKLVAEPTAAEKEDYKRILAALHVKPYWRSVVESFTKEEINDFEGNWVMMVQQFNGEVTAGEEIHLKNWLTMQILQTRTLKSQKNAMEEIDRLKHQLELEYNLPPESRDVMNIGTMQTQLVTLEASLPAHIKTHTTLTAEIKHISTLLKATREERRDVKVNEDTYWGYIEKLENEVHRKQESQQAELLKMATFKARNKMGQNHEFCDGTVDRVLLNSETIMLEDKDE